MDLGANIDGSQNGPQALIKFIKKNDLLGSKEGSFCETEIEIPEKNKLLSSPKFKNEITEVCRSLKGYVLRSLEEGVFPLSLGGDHSLAMGSIFASKAYCHKKGLKLGVVWFDAHADINTPESSETGNIHGMPLATVLGKGHRSLLDLAGDVPYLKGEEVALVGIRSVDPKEQIILDESSVSYYTMKDTKKRTPEEVAQEIKENLIDKVDLIHVSFDLDVMDPSLAPSVSTAEKDGMTLDEMKALLSPIVESQKLLAMDLVEYNPLYESKGRGLETIKEILKSVF